MELSRHKVRFLQEHLDCVVGVLATTDDQMLIVLKSPSLKLIRHSLLGILRFQQIKGLSVLSPPHVPPHVRFAEPHLSKP